MHLITKHRTENQRKTAVFISQRFCYGSFKQSLIAITEAP